MYMRLKQYGCMRGCSSTLQPYRESFFASASLSSMTFKKVWLRQTRNNPTYSQQVIVENLQVAEQPYPRFAVERHSIAFHELDACLHFGMESGTIGMGDLPHCAAFQLGNPRQRSRCYDRRCWIPPEQQCTDSDQAMLHELQRGRLFPIFGRDRDLRHNFFHALHSFSLLPQYVFTC